VSWKSDAAAAIPDGQRAQTIMRGRIVVKNGHDGGKVRFFFEDEGDIAQHHQQTSIVTWRKWRQHLERGDS
jgi:hypothetical protein